MKTILCLTTLLTLLSTGCVTHSDPNPAVKQTRRDPFQDYDQDNNKSPNAFHQRPDERDLHDN